MPDIVFTVYNCGTNFDRTKTDEIVANLSTRTIGVENTNWIITDGPGCGTHKGAVTPGTKDPFTGEDLKVNKLWTRLMGLAKGLCWEHNVWTVVSALHKIPVANRPNVINMVGWSRGAITCSMLAHVLAETPGFEKATVNIFALDPVPGPGNWDDPAKVTVPANVKNYTAVLMEDEARKAFTPVVVEKIEDDEQAFKRKAYAMPGGHSTGVKFKDNEVGTIVAYMVHKWLGKHGTKIKDPMTAVITSKQLCELYAKVRIDMHEYRKKKGSWIQRKLLGTKKRKIANDFNETLYFVNHHHANQFKKEFPTLWKAFDGPNGYEDGKAQEELKKMQQSYPTTYKSLEVIGVMDVLKS
ncbi:MAG: hypothetical protein ACAI25_13675 [Planctomycetota bacterium]